MAPTVGYQRLGQAASFWGLGGSASIRGENVVLTVVNPHASEGREAEIVIRDAAAKTGKASILTASDIHAHNSFDNPRVVEPREETLRQSGRTLVHRFPPASVTRLVLELV